MRENLCLGFANNKGADQPAHQRSQVCTFVIRLLESIIYKLSTFLASLFSRDLFYQKLPEDRFPMSKPPLVL